MSTGQGLVLTLARLTPTATLKGEEVGIVAVAPQAKVRPADSLAPMQVKHQLALCQLHHPGAQLHPLIIHIRHLGGRRQGVGEGVQQGCVWVPEPLGDGQADGTGLQRGAEGLT